MTKVINNGVIITKKSKIKKYHTHMWYFLLEAIFTFCELLCDEPYC